MTAIIARGTRHLGLLETALTGASPTEPTQLSAEPIRIRPER